MKKIIIFSLVLLFSITAYGKKKKKVNPYHTPGTEEYTKVTSKLIGVWTISSFTQQKKDKLTAFDISTFEFKNTSTKGGVAIFRFKLKKEIVDKRLHAWNRKGVTLTVDEYWVICKMNFNINKKGVLVYLENVQTTAEITGSGEQLENFQEVEALYIKKQSAMKESGGLGLKGMIGAKLLKEVSGVSFVIRIPDQINYKNLEDNSVEFIAPLSKFSVKLVK